ncbi:type I phosphomannose isomerase catalytic subunit [Bombilactobacillus thymidiniphilus]|uniref:Mannose-6-phosphate isomerase n=1 Tax=Bombilactobacillus thymidiniphilus TaxID=2923363 RepID=A0ABY4PG77_9LACO|nr:type I phosphomannose isomerase catalytic subunit [Bombilactobacillus thymidiniphilus]UQS84327.1 class I mannose-6-phosphate isomerase [Bombilactobacillus thymidiniphilus]
MMEPLFLTPVFQKKIWGGRRLQTEFDYNLPDGNIGECWAISAHHHGVSVVRNGAYAGIDLATLWQDEPQLFGNPKQQVFPLLVKILDAHEDLSVQVHPDNEYAQIHENELGKTECWYILAAKPGSTLVYGHFARDQQQLDQLLQQRDWQHLFRHVPVKTGDFVYVPSGTIHALSHGVLALETQQSSDTTYRIYDYDRVDATTGQKRALHLKQARKTITVPFVDPQIKPQVKMICGNRLTCYVAPPVSPYFAVWGLEISQQATFTHQLGAYTLVSVIDGNGEIVIAGNSYSLQKGDHLIIPATVSQWDFAGSDLHLITSEAIAN